MSDAGDNTTEAALVRKEDAALLSGAARFIDDLEPVAGLRHVAFVRSPHAHARIARIDTRRAAAMTGVAGVITGADLVSLIKPIPSAIRAPIDFYPAAVDTVRYVGEPVAMVAAADRYVAEDAADAISVDYEPLPAAVDPLAATADDAPLVHPAAGSNVVHSRTFRYGDPDRAFEEADRVFRLNWRYPRQSATPIETCGVIAHFEPAPERYTIWSNFQGPFILHALMCGALKVPGNRLRLITAPFSGGSFGIKQSLYPYMILLAAASRALGVPLKWTEDRLEHLLASSCAADRVDEVEAAFTRDGVLTGIRYRNLVDVGAYVRAPEPASVYRMHSAANGCYRVRDIAIENRVVVTNRMPVGLNRGYGGPQFYYALERVMDLAARTFGIDPGDIRRRNFIAKGDFPYRAPAGAVYDAGDYAKGLDEALRLGDYQALKLEREAARNEGRLYGIGMAAGVEPSGSNMAYVTLAQTPEERAKAGGRSGGIAAATVSIDPSGAVSVRTDSTPAGQGHATVAAEIVAKALGLRVEEIDVNCAIDTATSAWSLASGNYSNRFSSVVVGAVAEAAERVAAKIKRIAGEAFEVSADDIELVDGEARIVGVPQKALSVRRLASSTHWHPAGLPVGLGAGLHETAIVSPDVLAAPDAADRVASAVTFGYLCDLAAVEIDRETGRLDIRRYVSVHDVGTVLNRTIVEGQIRGGFAHGLGAALFEEMVYDRAGNFQSGTFADYLCPTAPEMPPLAIGQYSTPSPRNALGAKGMGDGSSMLAPTALANAVADALGRDDVELPLTPNRLWDLAGGRDYRRDLESAPATAGADRVEPGLTGAGAVTLSAPPSMVWRTLIEADRLAEILPGCERMERIDETRYRADLILGVATIKGRYAATIDLRDMVDERALRLVGEARGALGWGSGEASVSLSPTPEGGTRLDWRYRAEIGGKVAAVGQRMLGMASRVLIGQFFKALEARLAPAPPRRWRTLVFRWRR